MRKIFVLPLLGFALLALSSLSTASAQVGYVPRSCYRGAYTPYAYRSGYAPYGRVAVVPAVPTYRYAPPVYRSYRVTPSTNRLYGIGGYGNLGYPAPVYPRVSPTPGVQLRIGF